MKDQKYKLVVIEWIDATGCESDWQDIDTPRKSMNCRSVGWLVYDGDECKTVIPHLCPEESQGCGDMTIPTVAIKSVTVLSDPTADEHAKKQA